MILRDLRALRNFHHIGWPSAWPSGSFMNLAQLDGPVFLGTEVGGLDEGHGLEVVAGADGWFFAGLQRDE